MPVSLKTADKKMTLEFALVCVAGTLAYSIFRRSMPGFRIAFGLSVLALFIPIIFRPLATVWFEIGHILGKVSSKTLMTVVFFLFVIPIGTVRRWSGRDDLKLKQFKKGRDSVFDDREHRYEESDIVNTF